MPIGYAGHRGAFPPVTHSSKRSPMCPRCKLPRVEAHAGKANGSSRLPVIDGVYTSCCCPDIQMPDEAAMVAHPFLRRHSSLWEQGHLSPGLGVVCEEGTETTAPPGLIRALIAVPFETKNMQSCGQSIDPLEGHARGDDEELHVVEGG
jgi:hypothetical protein